MSKSNLAALPRSLAYALRSTEAGVAVLDWKGPTPWTANDLVGKPSASSRWTLAEECAGHLRAVRAGGPVPSAEVQAGCQAHGWNRATYEWAGALAGGRAEKRSFAEGRV